MNILGLTATISENIAACIIDENGSLVALGEEERYTGIKHAPKAVPKKSIEFVLNKSNLKISDIDYIVLGFDSPIHAAIKNLFKNLFEFNFERAFYELGVYAEYSISHLRLLQYLKKIGLSNKTKFSFIDHHYSHAASAVYFSGFKECIYLTIDGVGEDRSGRYGYFANNQFINYGNININQSLGLFYSVFTEICGFLPHSHEGKLMGLAAFGKPNFDYLEGLATLGGKKGYELDKSFGNKAKKKFKLRKRNEPLTKLHFDLAATAQKFLEVAVCNLAKNIKKKYKSKNLCLAGGVALNCDMNSKLFDDGLFENVFIQPASNDAGTALGAAKYFYHQKISKINNSTELHHAHYGDNYSIDYIEKFLKESKVDYKKVDLKTVAKLINRGLIVAWFSGKMEFGPRALGGRSILANPSLPNIKDKINIECKHRENWRPFAPSVLEEKCKDMFINYNKSPFMLKTFLVKEDKIEAIKAAVHIDNTARVQSVSKEFNPKYYQLINEFYKISGIPALLNTSFNDEGKPICRTPRDALQTFYSTGIDCLVLEDFLIVKKKELSENI